MLLEVEDISRNFGGLLALDRVSFALESGTIMGLIGPNGAGKSTLFNVIAGTTAPSSGTVRFDGHTVTGKPVHRIAASGIARTFQTVRPFMHLSVFENALAGAMFAGKYSRVDAEKKALEALGRVGLADKRHLPAHQLNIMSRKWLEVARILATSPRLVLLDEFMAGLNPAEVGQAVEFVRSLRDSGITFIVVEHIIRAIMNCCDRVVVLNAGQKIADAPPAEVVRNPTVIAAYLGSEYAPS